MTDEELRAAAAALRLRAKQAGSMSALWDIIFDIEAVLTNRPSVLSRTALDAVVQRELASTSGA